MYFISESDSFMSYAYNHFLQNSVKNRVSKTRVMWSKKPLQKAIIFIHGFNGGALSTWSDLPALIGDYREFDGIDLFFYSYDSLHTQTNNSSLEFFEFIDEVARKHIFMMHDFTKANRNVDEIFEYNEITIVAHSLGAVITRLALNLAYEKKASWLKSVNMLLFAPAHNGARIIPLLVELFYPKIFRPIGILWRYFVVTLHDLEEKSLTLSDLKLRTQDIQKENEARFSKALSVVWAQNERVVFNNRYLEDSLPIQFTGTNHSSVCKSSITTQDFLNELIKYI